jgi:hypothetical protein
LVLATAPVPERKEPKKERTTMKKHKKLTINDNSAAKMCRLEQQLEELNLTLATLGEQLGLKFG